MPADDGAAPCIASSSAAAEPRTAPQLDARLWLLVATFTDPKTLLRVAQLSKETHEHFAAAAKGSGAVAKYWFLLHHIAVWGREATDVKRLTFAFSLTRSEGKKDWLALYKEQHAAELRRTCQGIGCDHALVREAILRTSLAKPLNSPLTPARVSEDAPPGSPGSAGSPGVPDGAEPTDFEQACAVGGVALVQAGGKRQAGTRAEYKSAPRTKSKGKHERGKQRFWTQVEALGRDARAADHEY